MIRIITAIGNEELNNKLKRSNQIIIESSDIQYQEGIFEMLEEKREFDILILNEEIIGNLKIEELLKKIIILKNNIKIILIINLENKISENKNIIKIINNENYLEEILNYFNIQNTENKKIEINNKDVINKNEKIKKQNKKIKNEKENKLNKIINEIKYKINKLIKKNKESKIVIFIGISGIGKTTIIAIISKLIKNKKILIIDFNLINNNLHTIFGIKKYPKEIKEKINDKEFINEFKLKEKNLEKLKIKINNKIDIISETKIIFDEKYKINLEKIEELLTTQKQQYDLILIDTTAEEKYQEITKVLLKLSDKIICLTEGNLIQIKKTKELLNKLINEKIKINIILNKKEKYSINKKLLNGIFSKNKIIGEINYDKNYNKIINKNINEAFFTKKIKNDIINLIEKIDI